MILHRFTFLASALTFAMVSVQGAYALSTDDKTLNNGNAERFSDPDEHMPTQAITLSPSSPVSAMQGDKESSPNAVDPSTVRYDYDKDNGIVVPHTH